MFVPVEKSKDKETNYGRLLETLPHYIDKESPWYTTLANAASVLDYFLDDVNWVGFYVNESGTLFLGPFQGLAGCTKILFGHGVCGRAAAKGETTVVDDVHGFPGHITCDSESESEIVVPLWKEGRLFGVLDVDSPAKERFDDIDKRYLEKVARLIADHLPG